MLLRINSSEFMMIADLWKFKYFNSLVMYFYFQN